MGIDSRVRRKLPGPVGVLGVVPDVVDVYGAPHEGRPPRPAFPPEPERIPFDEVLVLGGEVAGHYSTKHVPVVAEDHRLLGLAEPHRILG